MSSLASVTAGIIYVTFEARDISWNPVKADPPFILVSVASDGSWFEYDVSNSVLPSSLQLRQLAAVIIGIIASRRTRFAGHAWERSVLAPGRRGNLHVLDGRSHDRKGRPPIAV
jgi:hypothetical protein